MATKNTERTPRIGFVSTRISGTDGVSLEICKWSEVLESLGYDCYYITGVSDRAPERTFLIEEADFLHPEIEEINQQCFGRPLRTATLSSKLHELNQRIKAKLYDALEALDLDLLIAQNSLTIPMNIPLGAALVEVLLETGLPCIAHHHDFVWERDRFLVNAVEDYLCAAFPPPLPKIQHVVINSLAGEEFSRRTGMPYQVIPNVMNFAHPPEPPDEHVKDLRQRFGVADDEMLILQPTRVVQRKGIEHTIELVRRLEDVRCRLVITHEANDEGTAYRDHLCRFAELMGVDLIFAAPWIGAQRTTGHEGCSQYAIWDVYPQADLVAYPSTYEGFGNAFLEAIYYRKPIFCNRYSIFRTEIEPFGFRAIVMDGFLTEDVLNEVRRVLRDEEYRQEMVEHNYQLARQHFSFERLELGLRSILAKMHFPS